MNYNRRTDYARNPGFPSVPGTGAPPSSRSRLSLNLSVRWIGLIALALLLGSLKPARADEKNPELAGVFSTIIPGSGQIYAGNTARGLAFMAGEATLAKAGSLVGASGSTLRLFQVATLAIHIWNIYDASQVARDFNNRHRPLTAGSRLIGFGFRF